MQIVKKFLKFSVAVSSNFWEPKHRVSEKKKKEIFVIPNDEHLCFCFFFSKNCASSGFKI